MKKGVAIFIGIFLLIFSLAGRGFSEPNISTLTVMPFTALKGSSEAWLSKGLADMVAQDLSQVESLVLLGRSQMQAFLGELELSKSGLIEGKHALRLGRVAKVDQVLYGNYSLSDQDIHLNVFLMDTVSQEILQTASAKGKLKDLRKVAQQVALDIIKKRGIRLSPGERGRIQFTATDSIRATEHFYTGIDLYDRGEYEDAFGRIFAATQKDPRFWEAQLWMGRVLEAQGQRREALLTYKKIYKKAPTLVEGHDAMMFAGLLAEIGLQDENQALKIYRTLSVKIPQTSHNVEASFRLAGILARKQRFSEAYRALQRVLNYHKKYSFRQSVDHHFRNSSFFKKHHAFNLYWDSVRQMILIYPDLTKKLAHDKWPELPAGAYLMDPKNPIIKSKNLRTMPTFFQDVRRNQAWEEYYYAIVVPNGYEITGVEMQVTGKVFRKGTSGGQSGDDYRIRVHPFPLARDIHSSWLGTLYGQTLKTTTLRKGVTFHGANQKIIVVEVGASQARVDSWQIKGLVKKSKRGNRNNSWRKYFDGQETEAMHLSTIPFMSGKFSGSNRKNYFYMPKKELTMAADRSGRIGLVTLSGALDGAESDLWFSSSEEGQSWEPPYRLPINSSSQEYNPHLVPAEDGSLQLFWISKRRGQDWEIWSSRWASGEQWSHPSRIPIEKFASWKPSDNQLAKRTKSKSGNFIKSLFFKENESAGKRFSKFSQVGIPRILEYSITQNRRGQWVLAYYSFATQSLVILRSDHLKHWEKISEIHTGNPVFGPSLIQDSKGVYRLALSGHDGRPRIYSSNDGRKWSRKEYTFKCFCQPFYNEVHSLQLLSRRDGKLTLFLSDNFYGLQYANFDPDTDSPQLDLVSRALMEPYAVAPFKNGKSLVALKQDRGVGIYQYKNFATHSSNRGNGIIYTESDRDSSGNHWDRIFAHRRLIIPDVTALALGPKGRAWWGIESGIMTLNGEAFSLQDVANGFFHNFITDIAPCSDSLAWVSSRFHEYPEVGRVRVDPREKRSFVPLETKRVKIPDAHGAVTAIQCSQQDGALLIGTSEGEFIKFRNNKVVYSHNLSSSITSIAASENESYSVGTEGNGIHRIDGETKKKIGKFSERVNDLSLDARGNLWAAVEGQGLLRLKNGIWKTFSTANSKVAYDRIGVLSPDRSNGIWYAAHGETQSFGVGYFDGKNHELFNPPQRFIDKPSALDVDVHGKVWIGTWFDGVYILERNKK